MLDAYYIIGGLNTVGPEFSDRYELECLGCMEAQHSPIYHIREENGMDVGPAVTFRRWSVQSSMEGVPRNER